ncbi:glycosyl hydrolase family 28-related protein [Paenibacillus terreus]|uniref:Glycosyl hydrolase family 28-related protein n=1 Tax=Paenibacillus terreus TaxID=1387834 RepID=A0ABV5B522_9BACL
MEENRNGALEEIGVRVQQFGAKGDGVTNDTEAIQQAIDSVFESGGGTVLLPKGTYLLDTLTIRHQVKIVGEGFRLTTLKKNPDSLGPITQIDGDFDNFIYEIEVRGIKFVGNYTDSTNDGVFCKTKKGINHCRFEDLWFQSIGRNGMRFEHNADGMEGAWVQYCHFENIMFGGGLTDDEGCQSYCVYAEGGFSTNTFKTIRTYYTKDAMFYLTSQTGTSGWKVAPEAILFDTCNPQSINNTDDRVTYGVYLKDVIGATFLNCYFEGVGLKDTSKKSANLYVTGTTAGVVVSGGYCGDFMNGIVLNNGSAANISGVVFHFKGPSYYPKRVPNCVVVEDNFAIYTAFIGVNSVFHMSGIENTDWEYLLDTGKRSIGIRNTSSNFKTRSLEANKHLQVGDGASGSNAGSWDFGFVRIRNNTLFIDTDGNPRIKILGTPSSPTDGSLLIRARNGATAQRPSLTNLSAGYQYFDTTLNKPIWVNKDVTGWVDATGTSV